MSHKKRGGCMYKVIYGKIYKWKQKSRNQCEDLNRKRGV